MNETTPPRITPATAEASIETFRAAIVADEFDQADAIASGLSPALLRQALTELLPEQVQALYAAIGDERLAALVRRLDASDASKVLQPQDAVTVADVLDELAPDDAADVIGEIRTGAAAHAHSILVEMDRGGDVQELLAFMPETAGGRMTSDFLAVAPDATAEEAILRLRERTHDGEFRSYIYVTDAGQLLGVLPLYRLVLVDPSTRVSQLMISNPIRVRGTDDQLEVARAFRAHRFLAIPVVDAEDRLIGIVTADDIADVMEQEATEDMFRMAGVGVKEHAFSPVLESASRRVPWLAFNMLWAFAGAAIISIYEGTLERAAVLAVFMPMIAGQCGNAGIQTATIVVRSMALGELEGPGTMFRLLRKEWALSIIKGVLFGTVLGLVAWLWKGSMWLGIIAGTAMCLNMLVAGTTGVVVPITLRRLGIDPATIAGVFDTMLTDLMGFMIYLGLATLLIAKLT